jgi:hypothetical protein
MLEANRERSHFGKKGRSPLIKQSYAVKKTLAVRAL